MRLLSLGRADVVNAVLTFTAPGGRGHVTPATEMEHGGSSGSKVGWPRPGQATDRGVHWAFGVGLGGGWHGVEKLHNHGGCTVPGTCCGRQCQHRAGGQAKGGPLFLKNKFSRAGRGPQDF